MKKILLVIFAILFLAGCDNIIDSIDSRSNMESSVDDGSTTDGSTTISSSDAPSGWASYTGKTDLAGGSIAPPDSTKGTIGGYGGTVVTVSTRADFIKYAQMPDPYIIYVDGMIDMTDGMLPTKYNGSTDKLDNFIKTKTSGTVHAVSSYAEWKKEYAENVVSTADQTGSIKTVRSTLNNAWGLQIKVNIASNKTIIGKTPTSGLKGGSIFISGSKNVIVRNITLKDCYNPFPKMEKDDGYNADFDCLSVTNGSSFVWIDHCTLQSSFTDFDHVTPRDGKTDKNKWQVYDGLLDITNKNDFVTVSWCKFIDHDKTMLIGNDKNKTEELKHQTITLHHNYYSGCSQRLPMVRFATIHIYNNLYEMNGKYSNSYAVGVREQVSIIAQNNYFGTDILYSFKNSDGKLYKSGNIDKSKTGCNTSSSAISSTMLWNPSSYYNYTLDNASDIPAKVKNGAGSQFTL